MYHAHAWSGGARHLSRPHWPPTACRHLSRPHWPPSHTWGPSGSVGSTQKSGFALAGSAAFTDDQGRNIPPLFGLT